MKNILKSAGLAIFLTASASVAQADVSCSDSVAITGSAGYVACQGSFIGNIAPGKTNTASFDGYGSFYLAGSTDGDEALSFGLSVDSGALSFDELITGAFVLGIKGGPTYSLYLFDGGDTGLSSVAFDTLGVAKGNGLAGPGLSHASVFLPSMLPVTAVPEAPVWAMLVGGLGLIGLLRKRG